MMELLAGHHLLSVMCVGITLLHWRRINEGSG